ncbi:unnamed protein product [Discosporangium mesarthrocarpum]
MMTSSGRDTNLAVMSIMERQGVSSEGGGIDRRLFVASAVNSLLVAGGVACIVGGEPAGVWAGENDETPVDWKAEFGTVRSESNRILGDLRGMTKNSDWEGLKAATKDADLTFRKKEMGGLRKKFPKELKDEGIMMCNAVTFDLIAISKAARGQDMARAEEVVLVSRPACFLYRGCFFLLDPGNHPQGLEMILSTSPLNLPRVAMCLTVEL